MIKYYYRNLKDKKLSEPEGFKVGSWIYAEDLDAAELEKLAAEYKLDSGLLQDALDPYEVPRLEQEGEAAYVFSRVPAEENGRTVTAPLLVIIGGNFVMTISRQPLGFLADFLAKERFYTTQKVKLFLQIFFAINTHYNKVLTGISRQVRGSRINLEKIGSRDIVRLVGFEEILNDFLSALIPVGAVLQKLLNGKYISLYEDDKDLIEDLFLSTGQLTEASRANLKTIVNIRDAYSTIMTQNLNRIMKTLTAMTILLTVPTMIFSFYGMNLTLPHSQFSASWLAVLSGTFVLSAALLTIFIRKRWF